MILIIIILFRSLVLCHHVQRCDRNAYCRSHFFWNRLIRNIFFSISAAQQPSSERRAVCHAGMRHPSLSSPRQGAMVPKRDRNLHEPGLWDLIQSGHLPTRDRWSVSRRFRTIFVRCYDQRHSKLNFHAIDCWRSVIYLRLPISSTDQDSIISIIINKYILIKHKNEHAWRIGHQ